MNDITKNQRWDHLDRPSVEALDAILGAPTHVLDHGFVRVIDYMGDEAAIVQAARVSYGAGTKTKSDDRGLIRYLMRHHHTTPFEMCEIKLHMKLPIFVARQWIRHRTASVNEHSARYSILANEFFVPDPMELQRQSLTNKQGRDGMFSEEVSSAMSETIRHHSAGSYQLYEELLHGWPWFNEDGDRYVIPDNPFVPDRVEQREPHEAGHGMARELARMVLPVNAYTEWYWKVDLHNLLHLLRLRCDSHAQTEIRAYADVIALVVQEWLPNVWDAFEEYQTKALTFSASEAEIVKLVLARNPGAVRKMVHDNGLSAGERREFFTKLGVRDAD
jgi:thymidylate synthase (FAD)